MSAILENNSSQSPNNTNEKFVIKGFNLSPSELKKVNKGQTQRFSQKRSKVSKKLNDLFLQTTQRNPSNKPIKSPVLLTEHGSPAGDRTERWNFEENIQCQQSQEVKGIQIVLAREGILQVFNCFQNFRSTMIESLSSSDSSRAIRNQIELYEAVSILKSQLNLLNTAKNMNKIQKNDYNDVDTDKQEEIELRHQNQILCQKNHKLLQQLHSSQGQDYSIQNSLINNSISYGNSSVQSSEHNDEDCFNLDFKIDKIGNNHHFPCTFGSKSTTASLQNSIFRGTNSRDVKRDEKILMDEELVDNSRVISQHSRYQLYKENDSTQIALFKQEKQYLVDIIAQSIRIMKELFRNQFRACNFALSKSSQLPSLQNILTSYKKYTPSSNNTPHHPFFSQAQQLMIFIKSHSTQLSTILNQEIATRRKEHKK